MKLIKTLSVLSMFVMGSANSAVAQTSADLSQLVVNDISECKALVSRLKNNILGSQWLIGGAPKLYQLNTSTVSVANFRDPFNRVNCYGQVRNRIFIADPAGKYCGWVEKSALLDDHIFKKKGIAVGTTSEVCPTPRAMDFAKYCQKIDGLKFANDDTCKSIPKGLRAKGVLLGTSDAKGNERTKFFTTPKNGKLRSDKPFFSVLEIHDVARGKGGEIMVLAGDGDGDIFGWINQQALELWPTRLGLFYGASGEGVMFKSESDLIKNWRRGTPDPDVTAGVSGKDLYKYVHGGLQLLSYPIVKTVDPANDSEARPDDTQYHKVIYLGQSGEGSATQVLSQAAIARKLANLGHLNLMIVIDTTESMVEYLGPVKEGIVNFIRDYEIQATDPTNDIADTRIAVIAYSDFINTGKSSLTDPINMEMLLAPTRVGKKYSVARALNNISTHKGLKDSVGKREEAALETVFQLSNQFATDKRWAKDGYNLIVHVADHGSRKNVNIAKILKGLKRNKVDYLPVAILTDDKNDGSRTRARKAFMSQAKVMIALQFGEGTKVNNKDIASVDLRSQQTQQKLADTLKIAVGEVGQAKENFRRKILGDELVDTSSLVRDWASSHLKLDEKILKDRGLDSVKRKIIVQSDTAFAPLTRKFNDGTRQVDWTYTVALETQQALKLRTRMVDACRTIGRPEQKTKFRRLVVSLAEMFSGDRVVADTDVIAILSDMSQLPGASQSILSQSPRHLLDLADSTDVAIIRGLKQDVCWLAYHLNNMAAKVYARPDQIKWYDNEWGMKPGEELSEREYRYKPLVGTETVYLPSFFFIQPTQVKVAEDTSGECKFFCE